MTFSPQIRWNTVEPGEPTSLSARGLNDLHAAVRRLAMARPAQEEGNGLPGDPIRRVSSVDIVWVKVIAESPNDDKLWLGQMIERLAGNTERNWQELTASSEPIPQCFVEFPDDTSQISRATWLPQGKRLLATLSGWHYGTPAGASSPLHLPLVTVVWADYWSLVKLTSGTPSGSPLRYAATAEPGGYAVQVEFADGTTSTLSLPAGGLYLPARLIGIAGSDPLFQAASPGGVEVADVDGDPEIRPCKRIRIDHATGLAVTDESHGVATVSADMTVRKGSSVASSVAEWEFTGAGVTVTPGANKATIDIPGGGGGGGSGRLFCTLIDHPGPSSEPKVIDAHDYRGKILFARACYFETVGDAVFPEALVRDNVAIPLANNFFPGQTVSYLPGTTSELPSSIIGVGVSGGPFYLSLELGSGHLQIELTFRSKPGKVALYVISN